MKISLVGDVMLGRLVNRELATRPPEYPWGDTLDVLREADLRVANLECVISGRGSPWTRTPKVFHFRTDPENVAVLTSAGLDMVSLANNHTLDYGAEALEDTLDALDSVGMARAGAGRNLEEARRPAFVERGGLTVALIAFTDNEPAWEAGADAAGVHFVPVDIEDERARALFELIDKTSKEADVVIVSAHWGPNRGYRPAPGHHPFAHRLLKSGADIVFGHSCHVFQAVEAVEGRIVLYSTGDFIDDYAVDPDERNDESFIFTVEADNTGLQTVEMRPTVIEDFRAGLARGDRAEEIAMKMVEICEQFHTRAEWIAEDGVVRAKARKGHGWREGRAERT